MLLHTHATRRPIGTRARSLHVGTPAHVYTVPVARLITAARVRSYTTALTPDSPILCKKALFRTRMPLFTYTPVLQRYRIKRWTIQCMPTTIRIYCLELSSLIWERILLTFLIQSGPPLRSTPLYTNTATKKLTLCSYHGNAQIPTDRGHRIRLKGFPLSPSSQYKISPKPQVPSPTTTTEPPFKTVMELVSVSQAGIITCRLTHGIHSLKLPSLPTYSPPAPHHTLHQNIVTQVHSTVLSTPF